MTAISEGVPMSPEGQQSAAEFRVKSGARVVAVLDFLHRIDRPARAYEIGRALDLAPSSANDLLKTLVELGYLDFDDTKKTYFPGIRISFLGQWLARLHPELQQVENFARSLARDCGENVVLFSQRKHKIQVLSVISGSTPPPINIFEGANLPVVGTAAGCALLMMKSHVEMYEIVRKTFRTRTCSDVVVQVGDMIQDCKRRGYASSVREDIIPDNWAIALPLPINLSSEPIVVGLGGPRARVKDHEDDLARLARDRISSFFGPVGSRANIPVSAFMHS